MDSVTTACSMMGVCAFGLTFVPYPLRSKLEASIRALWEKLFNTADPFAYIEISRKNNGISHSAVQDSMAYARHMSHINPFYEQVGLYLGSLNIEFEARRVCLYGLGDDGYGREHGSKYIFGLPLNETLSDIFHGALMRWTHSIAPSGEGSSSRSQDEEDRNDLFTLTIFKSDKHRLLRPYLHHISTIADEIRRRNRMLTLYTNEQHGSHWSPVPFKHPSTFDTIALDGDLAERIQADLKAFADSEEYYHSIGRAWKRGYLLYGPPGTGKSSLIAAIANFMQYDIYDLELMNVYDNSLLKTLLRQTKRKSIIVIEDIDCSMKNRVPEAWNQVDSGHETTNRQHGLTLSGLLNFADGLLSCCGEERIFIFTTNHKERLDSALLRCGRMDMHILLSYCSFSAFKKLASNYLGIENHAFYRELEEAMKLGVKITPASIAEILISGRKDPTAVIKQVMTAVKAAEPLDSDEDNKLRRRFRSKEFEGSGSSDEGEGKTKKILTEG